MQRQFSVLFFCLFCCANYLLAQQNGLQCHDVVYLSNGSKFQGRITQYAPDGSLEITTWNGLEISIPSETVRRIVQNCKKGKMATSYDFKEQGLYNATRLGTLIGQSYRGENTLGFTLSHTVGWMFRRKLGVGVGVGVETFNMDSGEPATYPVFVEARGYLQAKRTAPFWSVGAGWALAGSNTTSSWGREESWSGGWLAKGQLGYRLGNHFAFFGGLCVQKKTRNWQSFWGNDRGKDRISHHRLELGLGIIL